jgi:hypothetical protein
LLSPLLVVWPWELEFISASQFSLSGNEDNTWHLPSQTVGEIEDMVV